MTDISKWIWLVPAIVLIVAILPLPYYGYYMGMRWVVAGAAGFLAWKEYELNNHTANLYAWIFLVIALIFNPILPIHLSKLAWLVIDLGVAATFLGHYRLHMFVEVSEALEASPLGQEINSIVTSQNEKGWVKNFVVFFVTDKIRYEYDPQSAKEFIQRLSSGHIDFRDQQSILVGLNGYLSTIGEPPRDANDFRAVVKAIPRVLQSELAGYNSVASMRSYLAREGEVVNDEYISTAMEDMERDGGLRSNIELALLKFRLEEVFQKSHGQNIHSFSENVLAKMEATLYPDGS